MDGNSKTAIETLNVLLSTHPGHAIVFNDLAVLYYSIGDKKNAGANYERAFAIEPAETTFTKNLANFNYVEQDRLEDALRLYRNIINGSTSDVVSLTSADRISVRLGLYDEVKRSYESLRALEPQN